MHKQRQKLQQFFTKTKVDTGIAVLQMSSAIVVLA